MDYSTITRHFFVYKVTCKMNGKLYIGTTTRSLQKRWKQHLRDARTSDFAFHRAILKYGIENFIIELLEEYPDHKTMLAQERYWIKHYNTMVPNGYNTTAGGEGLYGMHHSEETKLKISQKPITPEFRERMREIANERAQDAAFIAKLSEANTGKHPTEAAREKIKEARRKQVFSAEAIEKRTQKIRGMKHSAQSIAHMSEAQKDRTFSDEHRVKISTTLSTLTPEQAAIVKFNAYGLQQKEYARMFGISTQAINGIVKGRSYKHITREHLPPALRGD